MLRAQGSGFLFVRILFLLCSAGASVAIASSDTRDLSVPKKMIGECLIRAADNIVEAHPSFELRTIRSPQFEKRFNETDERGRPIVVHRFVGDVLVAFADRHALQRYSCTFIRDAEGAWAFSWSGLGETIVK
jgi:hypothetical protein